MRWALALWIACALVAAPWRAQGAHPAAVSGIAVSTLPSDADVWIDGTYVGRSPLFVQGLAAGRHTLTITKAGWISQEQPLDVNDGVVLTGVRLLPAGHGIAKPAAGSIVFRRLPPDARVTLDGEPLPPDAREREVPSGLHELTIAAGKTTSKQTIAVYPQTTTAIAFLGAASQDGPAAVLALCSDFLPPGSFSVSSGAFSVSLNGHQAGGTIGANLIRVDGQEVSYDSAPAIIAGRLYLPLALLEKLTGRSAKAKS